MADNWQEFYAKSAKPVDFDVDLAKINAFVDQCRNKRKIVLVTVSDCVVSWKSF